jgi:hypothetical protein
MHLHCSHAMDTAVRMCARTCSLIHGDLTTSNLMLMHPPEGSDARTLGNLVR